MVTIGLILLSLVLISFEIMMPGIVLGFLGALAMLGAVYWGFRDYGFWCGMGILVGALVVCPILIWVELKVFLRWSTKEMQVKKEKCMGEELIGEVGEALTKFAPTGVARVAGHSYEAFCEDGFIEEGEAVRVVGRDTFRLVVRKTAKVDSNV